MGYQFCGFQGSKTMNNELNHADCEHMNSRTHKPLILVQNQENWYPWLKDFLKMLDICDLR